MKKLIIISILVFKTFSLMAWVGMPTPRLQVDGRYLKDPHGNIVTLHGVAITPSPWFNGGHVGIWRWRDFNVAGCLAYNKAIIDALTDTTKGWYMSYIRLHMDPHWSNTPGCVPVGHELPNCFNEARFRRFLDEVYIPIAKHAISRGLYVILRPPGVAPEVIGVQDQFNYAQYLYRVWDIVSSHPWIRSQEEIMVKLANEPVQIRLADGSVGSNTQAHFDVLKEIFQPIVNRMRANGFHNVIWIPGSGYQSHFKGFAVNPIEGENIGYAVHIYPGYWGGIRNYTQFRRGWDENVKPVADFAPIVVCEIDWSPGGVDAWGDGITGIAGGEGFGANFKKITDESGNVSWNLLAPDNLLHRGDPNGPLAYGGDPEACAYPTFHWWQEYAKYKFPRPHFQNRSISDNNDGTFSNPVINGNFPAPVVVRKNDTYYLISTNRGFLPDTTILESKDLVNWVYSNEPLSNLPVESALLVDKSDIHAGTYIETVPGQWWAIASYQVGPLGHFPHLLPATLVNGNLIIDESVKNLTHIQKPNVGNVFWAEALATNDHFRQWTLAPQWGWAGNHDNQKWSLLERAGYMRLRTDGIAGNIGNASNILSQRILAFPKKDGLSFGTIRMETGQMANGDVAGLAVFDDLYAFVGVRKMQGEKNLVTFINNVMHIDAAVTGSEIYIRAVVNNNTGTVAFYYSFDNNTYSRLGADFVLDDSFFDPFSAYRFGIFNYATIATGGYVDVDWFSTESVFTENMFYDPNFETHTEESLTLTDLFIDEGDNITVLTKGTKRLVVNAVFADGRVEDVGLNAKYTIENTDVFTINNGIIRSLKDGVSVLAIDYTGPLGQKKRITTRITSTAFPLTNELFNPSIWTGGTFDETTRTLRTGQWGFGGWQYDGLDLSGYKYVVARLGGNNTADVDFRLFDETSYWSSPAIFRFGNTREVVVVLEYARKGNGAFLNPKNIYIAGFWSNGANPFVIDTVFVSNSSEFDPPLILVNGIAGIQTLNLSGFEYFQGSGPSEFQSFSVSGKLLRGNIVLTAPSGFEISFNPTTGYAQNRTISHTGGIVDETTVYIRLRSGLTARSYTGNLAITSTGAFSRTITLSGEVKIGSSVSDPDEASAVVIKTEYFTITGQRVYDINNMTGVFIVREYMSNGDVVTSKLLKYRDR